MCDISIFLYMILLCTTYILLKIGAATCSLESWIEGTEIKDLKRTAERHVPGVPSNGKTEDVPFVWGSQVTGWHIRTNCRHKNF